MSDLVDLCALISRAGYSGDVLIDSRLRSDTLLKLGTFLLNGDPESPMRLNWLPRTHDSVAIAFGGGIDSYVAYLYAAAQFKHVHLIHVNYGHPYSHMERNVLDDMDLALRNARSQSNYSPYPRVDFFRKDIEKIAEFNNPAIFFHPRTHSIVPDKRDMDWGWKDYIVPARNLMLASIASQYADRVWIIANKRSDETVGARDKTTKFYQQASAGFSQYYGKSVRVESPFLHLSKLEMVKMAIEKFDCLESLKNTTSCYTPTLAGKQCGWCYSCFKRHNLFQALNVEYEFARHPADGPHWHEFQEAEKKKRG